MNKICARCKIEKPREEFSKSTKLKDGLHSWCRSCNTSNRVEWAKENPDKVKNNRLWVNYKLRPSDLMEKVKTQQNKCAICYTSFDVKPLNVDHDHKCCSGPRSCGKCVRGLLCNDCNRRLAAYELLIREPGFEHYVIEYLNHSPVV